MLYTELIKNFNRTREYMREFFVFGFRSREEVGKKSARSYDDERHTILTRVLMSLGVSEKTASEDACRIEHYISDESFIAIKKHLERFS